MRLLLILSVLLLVIPTVGVAMDSNQSTDQELLLFPKIMPPADILEKRLRARGLDQLVDHSNVIQMLAGSSKDIVQLSHEIGYIVMGYASHLKTQPNPELERVRSRVLEACLEDEPRALVLLQQMFLYVPPVQLNCEK